MINEGLFGKEIWARTGSRQQEQEQEQRQQRW